MCSGGKLTGETGSSGRGGRDWECTGSSFHWKRRLKEPVAVHLIWPCHRRTAVTTNTINSGWVSTRRQTAPAQCCNAHRHTQDKYQTLLYTHLLLSIKHTNSSMRHPHTSHSWAQIWATKQFIYHLKYQQNSPKKLISYFWLQSPKLSTKKFERFFT